MIKHTGSKFDEYSISPKIGQILLPSNPNGYELTGKDFLLTQQINV